MFKIKLVQDIEVKEKVECSVKVHAVTDLDDDITVNCPKAPEYKYNDRYLCQYHFDRVRSEMKIPPPPSHTNTFMGDIAMR